MTASIQKSMIMASSMFADLAGNDHLIKSIDHVAHSLACMIDDNNHANIFLVGVGKSNISAMKTAASLRSIGLNAFAIHATDAAHGDLGPIVWSTSDRAVIYVSNSGKTAEVVKIIKAVSDSALCPQKLKEIIVTGMDSSDYPPDLSHVMKVSFGKIEELNPNQIPFPNLSTLATTFVMDVITARLIELLGVGQCVFNAAHPGGELGKRQQGASNGR